MRVFIINENENYTILNIEEGNSFMLEQLSNAYEMPQEEVKEIFKGNEHLASNFNCTITKEKNKYKVVFNLDETKLIDDLKDAKMRELSKSFKLAMSNLDKTPDEERLTFDRQEREARAYVLSKNEADAVFVKTLAAQRGVEFNTLVEKIIQKADLYAKASANLIGKRQKYEDLINKATTKAELDEISVEF